MSLESAAQRYVRPKRESSTFESSKQNSHSLAHSPAPGLVKFFDVIAVRDRTFRVILDVKESSRGTASSHCWLLRELIHSRGRSIRLAMSVPPNVVRTSPP